MTSLDIILIIIGITVIALSATQGLLRVLIMFFAFYLVCIAAGMATLASEIIQGVAASITRQLGGTTPSLPMAQTLVFLILGVVLFIAAYFLSRVAFADTSIPSLRGFDNIFGALLGVVLALFIMAVLCNTWGVAVQAPRAPNRTWQSMRTAYHYSTLRPFMMQILGIYKNMLFIFNMIEYPPFFVPR